MVVLATRTGLRHRYRWEMPLKHERSHTGTFESIWPAVTCRPEGLAATPLGLGANVGVFPG